MNIFGSYFFFLKTQKTLKLDKFLDNTKLNGLLCVIKNGF